MSDTPRTDAEYCKGRTVAGAVSIEFAKQLERENNKLRAALERIGIEATQILLLSRKVTL